MFARSHRIGYVGTMKSDDLITVDEEILGGTPVFKGTRVPVRALFENLEAGACVNDFLEWFPGVTHEQVEIVLRHAEKSLTVA